jgi:hypothetical protein
LEFERSGDAALDCAGTGAVGLPTDAESKIQSAAALCRRTPNFAFGDKLLHPFNQYLISNPMMRAKSKAKSAADNATFVFKGTIKKLKATTMKTAPATDRTCIVTIDQVIEAPQNLARYTGQDITVELSTRRKVNAGDQMIFHSIGWLFGESVAVRSLYEETEAATTSSHYAGPVTPSKQRESREHFNDADLVISGKVIEVRLPKSAPARTKRATTGTATTRVSEHDPKWREAVIEVADVHKGSAAKKQVVIRFPASTDVAWRRAPKFTAGQEGYFMLHESSRANRRAASKGNKAADETFTVRDPRDYQPYSEAAAIKSIIDSDS